MNAMLRSLSCKDHSPRSIAPHQLAPNSLRERTSMQETSTSEANYVTKNLQDMKAWKPLMLCRWVHVTFVIIFILLIASIEIILKISKDRQGFGPTNSNINYVWTYGPTAVFTAIAAFWTQVDYRARQMQPWEEMAKDLQPASNSLLLDYISPNPVTVFFRSLKRRHWLAFAGLLGSILLKALIVISTGLFILQPVVLTTPLSMTAMNQFQISNFNSSRVDDMAGLIYVGVLLGDIEYPPGTNAEYTTELFNSTRPIVESKYKLQANRTVFTADLSCKPATLRLGIKENITTVIDIVAAHNEDCHISTFRRPMRTILAPINDTYDGFWSGDIWSETCDGEEKESDRARIVITSLYGQPNSILTNTTAFFCKPSVSFQQSIVTIDETGALLDVGKGTPAAVPNDLTSYLLSEAVSDTVESLSREESDPELQHQYPVGSAELIYNFFFGLVLRTSSSRALEDLTDGDMMVKGTQKVFKGVAAQIARQYFLVQTSTTPTITFQGKAEYTNQMLFTRTSYTRAMEAILSFLILVSMYLALRSHPQTTPQDPATIARLTSFISQSDDLNRRVSSTGFWPLKGLRELLQGEYGLISTRDSDKSKKNNSNFMIHSYDNTVRQPLDGIGKEWQPSVTLWYYRLALLLVPLSCIVCLEATFRVSDRDNGLLDVPVDSPTRYGSSLIPALVMVLTKLLFSVFDFELRIIDPYVQLINGFAKAKTSVLNKTIYSWKTDAFWTAFMNKRIAVGSSVFSVIVASFLTIAASGLYTSIPVSGERSIDLVRVDQFRNLSARDWRRPMAINLNNSYTTGLSARLVLYERMKSPLWTYGPYVIPTLSFAPNDPKGNNQSSIDVNIPVQRSLLTCQQLPQSQIELLYDLWNFSQPNSNPTKVLANSTLPLSPDLPKPDMKINWRFPENFKCNKSDKLFGDAFYEMKDGPFGRFTISPFRAFVPQMNTDCTTYYGHYGIWEGGRAKELNVVMCKSTIIEMQASVHFSVPGWKIQSVQVDEKTTRNISSSGSNIQLILHHTVLSGKTVKDRTLQLDYEFSEFIRNRTTGSNDNSLLKKDNFDVLYARMQDIHGRAGAQVLNKGIRSTNITNINMTIPATATNRSTFRLKQNSVSTRFLQSLLTTMMLCAFISILAFGPTKALPKNPCSIAAQASLVSGSLMMAKLPRKAQWMNEKDFNELFEGAVYSMGWSEGLDGKEWYGIDFDLRPKLKKVKRWWQSG